MCHVVVLDAVETLWWIAAYVLAMAGLFSLRLCCKNRIIRNARRARKDSDDALTALRVQVKSLGITVEEGTNDIHVAHNLQEGWYRVKADGHAAGPLNDEDRKTGGCDRRRDGFTAEGMEIVEEEGPAAAFYRPGHTRRGRPVGDSKPPLARRPRIASRSPAPSVPRTVEGGGRPRKQPRGRPPPRGVEHAHACPGAG